MSYPNTTPGTAVDITLPWNITIDQSLIDGTLGAWYKFTTGTPDYYLSVQVVNDAPYDPFVLTFESDGITPVQGGIQADRQDPIQEPVEPLSIYYFQIIKDGSPPVDTNVTITAEIAPNEDAIAGSILINDETIGFRALLINFNGDILRAVDTVSGEAGDVIPNGNIALEDNHDLTGSSDVVIYNKNFGLVSTIVAPITGNHIVDICSDVDSEFYVAGPVGGGGSILRTIKRYSNVGVLVDSYSITTTKLGRIGAPVGGVGDFLYWTTRTINDPVMVFDLITEMFTTDFVVAPLVNYAAYEVIVLSNNYVLVSWEHDNDPKIVYYYNDAGMELNTFTMPSGFKYDHMTRNVLSITDFVLWTQKDATNTARFQRIKLSDGSILDDIEYDMFDSGIGPEGTTQRFGPSPSCPLVLITVDSPAVIVGEPGSGIYQMVPDLRHDTIYISADAETTENVKLPDPFAITYLIGDE